MQKEHLTQLIEEISVDFVLTDPADTDTLRLILSRFHDVRSWAQTFFQPVLEEALNHIIPQMSHDLDGKSSLSQDLFDMVEESISVIQQHARHEFDFSRARFPFPTGLTEPPLENHSPPSSPGDMEKEVEKPHAKKEVVSSVPGLRHPGTLPSHLDMELFSDYLSLQPPILDKMEQLILSFEQDHNVDSLTNLKGMLHTQKGEAGFLNLADIERLSHATEDMLEANPSDPDADLLFSVIDWIRQAYTWYSGETNSEPKPINDLIAALGPVDTPDVKPVKAVATDDSVRERPEKQNALEKDTPRTDFSHKSQIKNSILVDTERLDRIINMIGELVIAESMVMQSDEIQGIESQELNRHLSQMDKITRGLQEAGLSLRMVPIRSTFQKIVRLVRDISKKSGKPIQCIMQGEDTELDKTLVDKIGEPLLHIIRNAADHGIETQTSHRIDAGKPEKATIHIRAFHKSGNIQIEIEDDGRGLDKAAILKKARESKLVDHEDTLSDHEIFSLIFQPGFSTSKEVTGLSGRGVGMNVVKTTIESLRGNVDVSTAQGKGTTFTIKIPLTLAIIDGMIVKSGKDRYIIPTLSIITSSKIEPKHVTSVVNKENMVNVQDQLIPLYSLSHLLTPRDVSINGESPLMVVVESNNRRMALGVDELIGKQQIVIKSLGESMKNIPGISGAAIMSDGRVALIIDVDKVANLPSALAHDTP